VHEFGEPLNPNVQVIGTRLHLVDPERAFGRQLERVVNTAPPMSVARGGLGETPVMEPLPTLPFGENDRRRDHGQLRDDAGVAPRQVDCPPPGIAFSARESPRPTTTCIFVHRWQLLTTTHLLVDPDMKTTKTLA
jgi:hypothetical protein